MDADAVRARREQLLTGERTSPGIANEAYWFSRHEAAYAWAAGRFGRVARACDAGSGEGYGTATLASLAGMACGLDLDAHACIHAATTYPDTCVVRANLVHLPLADAAFDLVVSMQVIEHLWDVPAYLCEIARVLAPGGHACISTPNRPVFSPGLGRGERPANPFHVQEFDAEQLAHLLRECGLVDIELHALVHGPRIADWESRHGPLAHALISAMAAGTIPPRIDELDRLDELVSSLTYQDYRIEPIPIAVHLPVQDLIAVGRRP